jgi:type IV pilus assembly protein PilM
MSVLDPILKPLRAIDAEALLNLRPAFPPVAVEVARGHLTLVRVKKARGKPSIEAYRMQETPERTVGHSIFRPNMGSLEDMAAQVRELFERSGTKPGRVSIVLPDNLAKTSIVGLPERPKTRRQLEDLLRFKLRRSVPFRLEDAVVSSWQLPGDGPAVELLVAVMLRSVVEQYESAFESIGARPGLVDLCTPSLFNLLRPEIDKAGATGDVAILNAARTYFTLLIVHGERVVFFRCKSYAAGDEAPDTRVSGMTRELATSLSYYEEKLSGGGIGTVFVRNAGRPIDELAPVLDRLGSASIRGIDPLNFVEAGPASRLDPVEVQGLAPALGAAIGRVA